MNLQNRVAKLEEKTERESPYDLTQLTDTELRAFLNCFSESGEVIPERVTPEMEAAWERVKR